MKKYKPFEKIPASIVGKTVVSKNDDSAYMVQYVRLGRASFFGMMITADATCLFNNYAFADGSPIGEEYVEAVELIHDKAYCVRMGSYDDWVVRYFAEIHNGHCAFYNDGGTSLSQRCKTNWHQVAEYDKDIVGQIDEPKNGYLFNAHDEQ